MTLSTQKKKRGSATWTTMQLSRRWRWVMAMAAPCTRQSVDTSWVDVEEMLKAKLATIFEDPCGEDEETTTCPSPPTQTKSTTALVARKSGGWKKVKELRSRFKKTAGVKASYVYFFAGFLAKGRAFHSPSAYLSN